MTKRLKYTKDILTHMLNNNNNAGGIPSMQTGPISAKNAGLTLAELRAANPEIMKKKKYKQGSMIWSGTTVNIPKK